VMRRREFLPLLGAASAFAGPRDPVKITGFSIHKSTLRWRDLVFLEVHTDSGITGLGEATLETRADLVEKALEWLEPTMKGLDPSAIEQHWNRNYYGLSRWRHGAAEVSALSAVDIALWDIEGKRLGVPSYRLLGGPLTPRMKVYYTHWSAALKQRTPQAFADWAIETRTRGWKAVKWTAPMQGGEKERIAQTVAEVEAVRVAVGKDLDIGIELAETHSLRSALELARELDRFKPLFIEEPVLRENPAGLGELAAKSPVPVATGEGLLSRWEFRTLLEARGAAIVQPDVMHAGGITELKKIAAQAETYGVEIAPHQCSGPVAHMASLAAMASCRNFLIQEWEADDDEIYKELTAGTYPTQKNGHIALPDAPGLGLRIDFAEWKRRLPYSGIRRRSMLPL
jgi:galactonate dehydratase